MVSVLLVEFAATDRFHRKGSFPYFQGWLKSQGVPVRWLRFGVAASRRFERGETGIGLFDDELRTLQDEISSVGATHVLFGSCPAAGVATALRAAKGPGPRLAVFGEAPRGRSPHAPLREDEVEVVEESAEALAAMLGLHVPDQAGPIHRLAVPDFGFQAANEAARTCPALPFLLLGRACTYSNPFAQNPFLADLDLEDCFRRGGCAFCVRPAEVPGVRDQDLEPAEIRRHVAALHTTLPVQPDRVAVRLDGEAALFRLEALVEAVVLEGFRDFDWLLDARADDLVAQAERLARACARLEGTGNRLHVALVGIENFSAAELLRLNKGITPLTNLAAVATLLELETRCPETFAFRQHGGLSLILFSPWTTLADLRANLKLLQVTGIEPLCGKVYTSRLRLVQGLPLTERARQDGLLIEAYDDPLLDTAARNLYDPELPWRFDDPALETLCRLFLRFPGGIPAADPLAEPVRRLLAKARECGLSSLDLALSLVDAASADEGPREALTRAGARLDELAAELHATRRGERWYRLDATGVSAFCSSLLVRHAVALSKAGVKPVSKLEPLSEELAAGLLQGDELPNPRLRLRRVGIGDAPVREVFFGVDAESVARAICASDRLEHPESDDAERQAIEEAGRLLGYPACCSDAFAAQHASGRWSYAWLHLRRRVEIPGAVPWELNPWASSLLTPHVPCRLDCEASLAVARASAAVLAEVAGGEALARLEQQATHPWLAVLEGQGSAIELIPESPPGERFRYRAGSRADTSPALASVAEGDELVLEPLRLLVLKGGRVHADLSLAAFVWWHERCLQAEEWARLLAIREAMARHSLHGGDAAGEPDVAKASPRLMKLRKLLMSALGPPNEPELAGFGVQSVRVISQGRLRLVLARAAERVVLDLEDARDSERCWQRVGPFALTLPRDAVAPGADGLAAAKELTRRLAVVLRAANARLQRA